METYFSPIMKFSKKTMYPHPRFMLPYVYDLLKSDVPRVRMGFFVGEKRVRNFIIMGCLMQLSGAFHKTK